MMAKVQAPPEEDIKLTCSLCGRKEEEIYLCRERAILICPRCQEKYQMQRCPHKHGEHSHILIPGIKNRNEAYIEEALSIENAQKGN